MLKYLRLQAKPPHTGSERTKTKVRRFTLRSLFLSFSLSLPPRFSLFLAQLQGQHVTNKCIHSLFVSASGLRGETRGWGALVRAARSTGLISPDEKVKCSFSPSPFHQTVSGWPTFTAPAMVLCLCLCLVQKCDSTGERIYLYAAGKNALIMGVIDLISVLVCLHNVS